MYVIAGADNKVRFQPVCSIDNALNKSERNKEAVVQVRQVNDTKSRERLREIWHRDSIGIRQDNVALDENRVTCQES